LFHLFFDVLKRLKSAVCVCVCVCAPQPLKPLSDHPVTRPNKPTAQNSVAGNMRKEQAKWRMQTHTTQGKVHTGSDVTVVYCSQILEQHSLCTVFVRLHALQSELTIQTSVSTVYESWS
jgi:hypothetical protein